MSDHVYMTDNWYILHGNDNNIYMHIAYIDTDLTKKVLSN